MTMMTKYSVSYPLLMAALLLGVVVVAIFKFNDFQPSTNLRSSAGNLFSLRQLGMAPESTKFRQLGGLNRQLADNVVFGFSNQQQEERFAIFAGSLLKHSNNTDIVVFLEAPASERYIDIARQLNVLLVEYQPGSLVPEPINKFHATSLRWVLYEQFMEQNEESFVTRYEKIMFADVADTAFQSDPFLLVPEGSNFVFQEGSVLGAPIAHNQWMNGWIKDCFGQKMLDMLEDKNIINSGVSIFSYKRGRYYTKLMSSILLGESFSQKFPTCERAGVDQGLHNVIVHLGLVPDVDVKSEADFPLVNVESSEIWNNPGIMLENLQTHSYDRVSNSILIQPVAVIHQYDVVTTLLQELAEIFAYWKNFDNAIEMWQSDNQCDSYFAYPGEDYSRGVGQIGSSRASSANECCSTCNNLPTCSGFYYVEGTCYFKSAKVSDRFLYSKARELNWGDRSRAKKPVANSVSRVNAAK